MANDGSRRVPSFAMIRGQDQWQRASYASAALVDGIVQLGWEETATEDEPCATATPGAGMALDAHCRLYHSLPGMGSVERILLVAEDPLRPVASREVLDLFQSGPPPLHGHFASEDETAGPLREPRGLATDDKDRLFIAETAARRVLVWDLWDRCVLRRSAMPGGPLDLVCSGRWTYAVIEDPGGLVRFTLDGRPQSLRLPAGATRPSRLALSSDGRIFVLDHAGTEEARIFEIGTEAAVLESDKVAYATDIEFYAPGPCKTTLLVVARGRGQAFLRFAIREEKPEDRTPLTARNYDGLGILRTPDERIAYWTPAGLRYATAARIKYRRTGRVIGFRLDGGDYQTTWGRLLIDACIPRDTDVRVRCLTADESPEHGLLTRRPPDNGTQLFIRHDDQSPPMPASWMIDGAAPPLPLHRRGNGSELPWLRRAAGDDFETYEGPVFAPPGRYLWVVMELSGNGRTTPRIRALRAEYPGHDYLRRLPGALSDQSDARSFLQRYLTIFAGTLSELELRAALRSVLLDPEAAPEEILPWLAGFTGLTLDERWSVAARRQAILEAVWLFRFRGTIPGLSRFIEIVLGVRPIIIEKFRLRSGSVIGEPAARSSRSVLGAGLRVGGTVGRLDEAPLSGQTEDAFETHAHRFTVFLPALLDEEEVRLAADLLELHRPAHTLYDLCSVGAGMRVGRGLNVGLTSLIGRGSGWSTLRIGDSVLGRGAVVGRPRPGIRVGIGRIPDGDGTRCGDARVG